MRRPAPLFIVLGFAILLGGFSCAARADEPVFSAIGKHLKSRYNAKERHIPFMGLAGFAIKLVRPAGVKSLQVKIYENLNYKCDGSDNELNSILQSTLGAEWQALVRVFSRKEAQQTFVYVKQEGKSIRLMVVAIQQDQATLVRLKVNPDTLAKWMDNPKILGISLGGPIRS
jgi:hypothetical protein